jgi:RNA polymerase sigma-70 factor, ECF subfamily
MPMSRARTESGLIAVKSRIAANISVSNADVQARSHVVDPSTSDRVALLVERAKRGDRDAFGELYRACYAPLFRVARFHLGAAAEDVVAETFLRAWAGIERYRDTGAPFIAWLHGIARHVVADELARRRRVEPRAEPPEHSRELSVDEQLTLAQAMDRLPQEQRQVLELKFLVGLTNSEVAAALGKTTGAVNTKQWRALEALRQTLGER